MRSRNTGVGHCKSAGGCRLGERLDEDAVRDTTSKRDAAALDGTDERIGIAEEADDSAFEHAEFTESQAVSVGIKGPNLHSDTGGDVAEPVLFFGDGRGSGPRH